MVLLGALAMVLLIACASVANLALVRGAATERVAVRTARRRPPRARVLSAD